MTGKKGVKEGISVDLKEEGPIEWSIFVYPKRNIPLGREELLTPTVHPLNSPEVGWARPPCCGTICPGRRNKVRKTSDCKRFGMCPLLKMDENIKLLDNWHEPVMFKSPIGHSEVMVQDNSMLSNKTIFPNNDSSPLLSVKTEEPQI